MNRTYANRTLARINDAVRQNEARASTVAALGLTEDELAQADALAWTLLASRPWIGYRMAQHEARLRVAKGRVA